ncbi:MAG: hypothetical protein IJA32_12455 [Lachnospiraceae bacterium]|nr:hypothetical protein [Lachnospiraceae bacterium]
MFFKMLKKDLKLKKGLNVILFLFMTVASILVVASAIQVYAHLAGKERTFEICNSSDLVLISQSSVRDREKDREKILEWLNSKSEVEKVSNGEMIEFVNTNIDFENYEEDLNASFFELSHFITKQNFEQNVVYDLDDKRFYVENGCIAIPQTIKDMTGVSIGDKVKLTTQMGYTYEFTVSHFFKDPMPIAYQRYIVSDADYELISEQSPIKVDTFELKLTEGVVPFLFLSDYAKQNMGSLNTFAVQENQSDDSYIILYVVSVFMVIISIFMILIIFMTIRFTMISAIKEEEKEIGMMKAIGVDSFGFRWLFAAKYIAFSVIGGIIGIFAGIPVAKIMLTMFSKNTILPDSKVIGLIGIMAVVSIVGIMILFTMFVMQRMKKISVMDAIHGENRGERFGKTSGLYLHKRKKMPISLFLAVSDVVNRLKRYLFLIVAYTLGITVILCTVHLKNSVISEEFLKYQLGLNVDFYIDLSDEQLKEYLSKTGSETGMLELINEELEGAGIPAKIHYDMLSNGTTTMSDGEERDVLMLFGEVDTEEFTYREGGTVPELKNEIALSYFSAKEKGLKVGDKISITYYELGEDNISMNEVKGEFIITGFFDYMEQGTATAIMGNEFENGYEMGYFIIKEEINAPEKEKDKYVEEIRNLYGAESVKTIEEYLDYYMADFNGILTLLEYVLSTVIILVLILITSLYSSVLLEEEIPSIAMLKSLGFETGSVKAWQLLRMGILLVISVVAGNVIVNTAGQLLVTQLFGFLGLTGFTFIIEPISTYILVPLLVFLVVLVTMLIRLKSIKNIEIWKIREE